MKNNKVTSKSEMDQDNEASRYYETLKDLTINSRPHIVNLTELARDSKIPETIVNIIAKRIESVSRDDVLHRCLLVFTSFFLLHSSGTNTAQSQNAMFVFG